MTGVLFAHLETATDHARRSGPWHPADHVPPPPASPGFLGGHFYSEVDYPTVQALVYELDDVPLLDWPEGGPPRERSDHGPMARPGGLTTFVQVEGRLIAGDGVAEPGPAMFALWFDVPIRRCEEFDAWYVDEHGPLLLNVAGWRRWRLFDVARSNRAITRLVLHDLGAPGAKPRLRKDRRWQTPGFRALRSYPWFRDVTSHEYLRIT